MASFVAMQAPPRGAGPADGRIVLVRDGFAVFGFLVPVLWFAWHRLWIEALAALAVTLALGGLGEVEGFGWAVPLLTLIVSIYVGLDGAGLRLTAMRRRGFVERAVIDADDRDAAEMRFFYADDIEARDASATFAAAPAIHPPAPPRAPAGPALGLLQYPGR